MPARRGVNWYIASRRSAADGTDFEITAYDKKGAMRSGLIWIASYFVPAGKSGRACANAVSTRSSAWFMSEPHGKSTKSCADPREVVDDTSTAPGTARAACSSGSVTSISICFAGMDPASTFTRMRGKLVTGKSPTGSAMPA